MQVAVFNNPDTGVAAVVTPAPGMDVGVAAEQAVPEGVQFWVVESEELPTDRTFRDAWVWETELSPNGIGAK